MCPLGSAGKTVCEIPDVLSLLQVSTQLSHGGPSSSSDAGGAEDVSNAPLASSVGTKKGHADEVESWRLREYRLVNHRKAGTVMCWHAASNMNSALSHQLGSPVPFIKARNALSMHWPLASFVGTDKLKFRGGGGSHGPVCYAHVARNPFEMVVSGYLYNMAESEGWWKKWKLGQSNARSETNQTSTCTNHTCTTWKPDALAELFHSSRSGPLSAWLPEANANETYPEYLQRVNLDAGLLAEFIVASKLTLEGMRSAVDFMESRHCSINVCFEDFYENCGATWHRVLQVWQIPEHPYGETMLHAATKTCPGLDPVAVSHSSGSHAEMMNLTHAPEHVMVKRLKELDRLRLNGRIAALEEHVKCPVSGKYKEPA